MWLKPDRTADTVFDIDYAALYKDGARALLFDLDKTLGPRKAEALPERAYRLLESLAEQGFRIGILTNRRRPKNDAVIDDLRDRHVLLHSAGKPRRRGFLSLLDRLDATPAEGVMIGDKRITDIVGANRVGIFSIRVRGYVDR